jgi:hypothetical protein
MGIWHLGQVGGGVFLAIVLTLDLGASPLLTVTIYCRGWEVICEPCAEVGVKNEVFDRARAADTESVAAFTTAVIAADLAA